ncbi:location of vulva defective 1-like [Phlebotomus papatasi]|uniref:location of vulva defective 1-like n=1 Tax=Phlebotomus papatasi TaxID=29031 RepID=UPI0024843EB9|nr:location of vulva defective 1-like [Phlebotomus papatasi]
MLSYVIILNLLLAIPWGFVVAQEDRLCEILEFNDPVEFEACDEFIDTFYETTYDEEVDSPPKLRPESVGLLAATGSACVMINHEFTLSENSGLYMPVYSERNTIRVDFVDITDHDSFGVFPRSEDSVWFVEDVLENIAPSEQIDLPAKFKVKITAENPTGGKIYLDFIQIFNTEEPDDECSPRIPSMTETPPTETDSTTEEPTDSTTEESTDSTTEESTDSTTEEPTDSTTEESTDTTTEEPTDSTTEESTDSTTEEPTDSTTEEPTDSTTEESTDSTTEEPTDSTTEEPTDSTPTEETEDPSTDSTPSEETTQESQTTTQAPTEPEPEEIEPEWKVVAAVFISLFCGACVVILLLIFKPFLMKPTPASSGLVSNEHPMSRTTLPRLQVDAESGISGVNRTAETRWP